jgi:hypothetical protein
VHGLASLLLLTLAAVAVVGCSDDTITADDTPTPFTRPDRPSGIVEGTTFTSVALGYAIEFPEGWTPDEAIIDTPSFVTDVFLSPTEEAGVKTNVTVSCAHQMTDAAGFLDSKRRFAEEFQRSGVEESATAVLGTPGIRLVYEQQAGATTLRKTETHFAEADCGWTVALTEGLEVDNSGLYDQMLSTFRFRN